MFLPEGLSWVTSIVFYWNAYLSVWFWKHLTLFTVNKIHSESKAWRIYNRLEQALPTTTQSERAPLLAPHGNFPQTNSRGIGPAAIFNGIFFLVVSRTSFQFDRNRLNYTPEYIALRQSVNPWSHSLAECCGYDSCSNLHELNFDQR